MPLRIFISYGGKEHKFTIKETLQKHKSPGWANVEITLISELF